MFIANKTTKLLIAIKLENKCLHTRKIVNLQLRKMQIADIADKWLIVYKKCNFYHILDR